MSTLRRVSPLLAAVAISCSTASTTISPSGSMWLHMAVPDFRSSLDSGEDVVGLYPNPFETPSLCVGLRGGFAVGDDERGWSGNPIEHLGLRSGVTRVSDASRIPGELRWGWFDLEGNPPLAGIYAAPSGYGLAVCFVPEAPLEEGWHVLRVDFSPWTEFGTRLMPYGTDGVVYARFHIGSRPTWYSTEVECWDDGRHTGFPERACLVTGRVSEEVGSWGTTTVEVRYDGGLAECSVILEPGSSAFGAFCPFQVDRSEVAVRLISDVVADLQGSHDRRHALAITPGASVGRELLDPRFGLDVAEAP